MQVREVMTKDVVSIDGQETAAAAARLLSRTNVGALPVCGQDGKLKGMLTDRDIVLRCVAANLDPNTVTVQSIMSKGVISVAPEDMTHSAAALMAKEQVRRLPVAENGRIVGMVCLGDLATLPDHSMEAAECLSDICKNVHKR